MADELNDQEPPSKLRGIISEQAGQLKSLQAELAQARAAAEISQKGYQFVKPEEFAGIDPAEVAAKVAETNAAREEQGRQYLAAQLKASGVPEDQIEARMASLVGGATQDPVNQQWDRASSLSGVGTPSKMTEADMANMDPKALIQMGLTKK